MPGNGDGTFGIPTFVVGPGPTALAPGDLNQDGWLDVAVIKRIASGNGGLSVRLGQPGRTFAPQMDYQVAEYPQGVTMGEVNHDGFVDIVVASYYFVSLLPGDGAGSLGARTDFPANNAHSPVLADLDQDGNLDVILAETGVTFRLGDGAGSFAAPHTLATPATPNAVRTPDLDIAVANNGSSSLAIFAGDGLGSLSRLADVTGISRSLAVATLDTNHDGRLDIVALSEWISVASVHYGLGDGTFASSGGVSGWRRPDRCASKSSTPAGAW